jgi:hypothetical protein
MKILSIILVFVNFGFWSQESILPKNEDGIIYFEEEIKIDNIGKEALYNNALKYVATVKKENKKKSDIVVKHDNKEIEKKGSFLVYTQGLITPQVHGEISYNVRIQVFDEGYKYTFTNFVFNYYQRNRYGRYAPVSGKTKPLEDEKFAGMQKIWAEHKQHTKQYVENQIVQLKNKMSELPPGAKTAQNKEGDILNID